MMKKKIVMIAVSLILLLMVSAIASAQTSLLMQISGETSDRVHLRAEPSAKAESKGLYFTGTPVVCPFGQNGEWTQVMIGAEKGYVYSALLKDCKADDPEKKEWKQASVKANGWVNFRSAPDLNGESLQKIQPGEKVAVLGETKDRWCYVKYHGMYGYMMSKYLAVSDERYEEPEGQSLPLPIRLPAECFYASGVGAWSTQMVILPDGTFWGYYHDADMGDAADQYPYGTLYECSFTGRFGSVRQAGRSEHQMNVACLQSFGVKDQKRIQDRMLVVTAGTCGMAPNELFSLYQMPAEQAPEDFLWQMNGYSYRENQYGLYGHTSQSAWWVD